MSRNIIYNKYKSSSATSGSFEEVVIEKILANPLSHHRNLAANQETRAFSTWLSDSIKQIELLHPFVVRPKEDYFELVVGSRSLAACKSEGWCRILCHIIFQSVREAYETFNEHSKTLEPIEEAYAFIKYIMEFGRSRVGHGVAPARTTEA